jgi:hypothetical protein
MITTVVFDMDGVLCHYRIERQLALLASWSGRSPDAIHAAITNMMGVDRSMLHHCIRSRGF